MPAVRVTYQVVPDDGEDGIFWENGERYCREKGRAHKMLDLAPNLEARLMMEILVGRAAKIELEAHAASLPPDPNAGND